MIYPACSMAGGGVRCVMQPVFLDRIEKELPGFRKRIKLWAGTSGGGMNALGMANDLPPAELVRLYAHHGPIIFKRQLFRKLAFLWKAEYSLAPLHAALLELFEETTLGDLPNHVLVTAYDLRDGELSRDADGELTDSRDGKPKLPTNMPGEIADLAIKVVDAGVWTSVPPLKFPAWQGYMDGGIYAADPAMCALSQMIDPKYGPVARQQDIVMLSLGSGYRRSYITGSRVDRGVLWWATHAPELILHAQMTTVAHQIKQHLGNRVHILNPVLPAEWAMDDAKHIPAMVDFATELNIDTTLEFVETRIMEAT